MADLEKDVELLETAIEDIEEEIEEIIDTFDLVTEDGEEGESNLTKSFSDKVDKAKLQLSELLELIRNMKKDKREQNLANDKKTRLSMLEDIEKLKEELDALQEEKEVAEEKLYEQGVKIRRLLEENKELKKENTNVVVAPKKKKNDVKQKRAAGAGNESGSESDDVHLKEEGDEGKVSGSTDDDDDEDDDQSSEESGDDQQPQQHTLQKRLTPAQRIDAIMKKESSTLSDLFDKEDLHEELASRYGSRDNLLITFLSRPPVLTALIDTIVNIPATPPVTANNEEDKEVPAVPYTASEILTSGIQPLTDMLVQPPMLQRFFALLDRPPPLPGSSPIASLWYKVMSHLLQVKSMELSLHIKTNGVLPRVVNHINSECVLNLLLTMLNTEAKLETYGDEFQWSHLQLIELLATKLDSCAVMEATSSDWPNVLHHTTALDNISEFLCEILTKYPFSSPLVLQMQETAFVKRLVRNCFVLYPSEIETANSLASDDDLSPNGLYASRLRGPVHCLQILVHILSLSVNGGNYTEVEMPPVITELLNDGSPVDNIPAPIHTIAAVLRALTHDMESINQKNSAEEAALAAGSNKKKTLKNGKKLLLGEYRMRMLMVAVGLARSGYFWVDHALLEAGVLQSIFFLFFAMPWNNVVHTMITELIISLLPPQSPPSRSGFCLVILKDLQFLENTLKIAGRDGSTGQLGHVANVTTAIHRAATITQPIADYLLMFSEWPAFVRKMTALTEVSWQAT